MAQPVLSANSPSTGYIAWTTFTVDYTADPVGNPTGKVTYTVAADNTNLQWVYWKYNGGSPTVVKAADTSGFSEPHDLLLFVNRNGVGVYAYKTSILDGSLIVNDSIWANAIAANQINTAHLQADSITSEKVAADAINAKHIAAGSIGAESLSIGAYTTSAVVNPFFEDWDTTTHYNRANNPGCFGSATGWNNNNGTLFTAAYSTTAPISGAGSYVSTRTATSLDAQVCSVWINGISNLTSGFTVTPGNSLLMAVDVNCNTASRKINVAYIQFRNSGGLVSQIQATVNGAGTAVPTTGSMRLIATGTVPAGAESAYLVIAVNTVSGNATAGELVRFDNFQAFDGNNTAFPYVDGNSDGYCWSGTPYASPTIAMPQTWVKHLDTGFEDVEIYPTLDASALSGNRSLTMEAASGKSAGVYGQFYPVNPGQSFYVKADVKAAVAGSMTAGIGLFYYNSAGTYLSQDLDAANVATTKTTIEFFGAVPAGAFYCVPFLLSSQTTALTWDNIQMGVRVSRVQIQDGEIVAEKLAVGAVTADKISAGYVSGNQMPNGNFQDAGSFWSISEAAGAVDYSTVSKKSGNYALRMAKNASAGTYLSAISNTIVAMEGRSYYVEVQALSLATMASGYTVEISFWTDALAFISTANICSNAALSSSSWTKFKATNVAPANARFLTVRVRNNLANSTCYTDEVLVREQVSGDVVATGTITGSTVQTATTGQRVELSADYIKFHPGFAGADWGIITTSPSAPASLSIDGPADATYFYPPSITLKAGTSQAGANREIDLDAGQVTVYNNINAGGTVVAAKLNLNSPNTGTAIPNTRFPASSGGELAYTSHANSSKRYKKNIKTLALSREQMYSLRPVKYNLKKKPSDRPADYEFWGLVAEEMDELGMSPLLGYNEAGQVDEVDYAKVCVVQQAAIRDLNERVQQLEKLVEQLLTKKA